jgi:cobalamin biosynthesis Mg chelatase CobN
LSPFFGNKIEFYFYLKVISNELPTTTTTTTTTSTTTTTTITTTTTEEEEETSTEQILEFNKEQVTEDIKIPDLLLNEMINTDYQKQEVPSTRDDNLSSIGSKMSILVGIIGILVIVIVCLLFLIRR